MPLVIGNRSGDGVSDAMMDTVIQLPDSGSSVAVVGGVAAIGHSAVGITGSPLTAPAVPGSGSTYWNIQVDAITGAATVQTSSTGDPAVLLSSDSLTPQIVIFRQTLTSGSSSSSLDQDTSATPDQPI